MAEPVGEEETEMICKSKASKVGCVLLVNCTSSLCGGGSAASCASHVFKL